MSEMVGGVGTPSAGALGPRGSGSEESDRNMLAVLGNRRFLWLWLAQVATQVGGNMVLYGLTVMVYALTQRSTSVSILILTFLVPAVIFSAVAGVYVDRIDRRLILIVTNVLRGIAFVALFFVADNVPLIYLLTIVVATLTTFFGPAEAAMIPIVVARRQLLAANGIFIFTLQASFALGFALLGPLAVNLFGTQLLLLLVALLYLVAAGLCWALPAHRPLQEAAKDDPVHEAERAVAGAFTQLRDGLRYIAENRTVFWPLTYLAITASLIGVLGVLGPGFAKQALGLGEKDFVVVVLPLGIGLVMGILVLNLYGRYVPRRRMIEGGLVALAVALGILALAGPISGVLEGAETRLRLDLGPLVSLLAVVVVVAFAVGMCYAFVAVPAQTQLQEELPPDVRGRVFGVLNMLVSVASFLPIVVVGPVADLFGTPAVILASAIFVALAGVGSILWAHPLVEAPATPGHLEPVDPISVATAPRTPPHGASAAVHSDRPDVGRPGRRGPARGPGLPAAARVRLGRRKPAESGGGPQGGDPAP